MLVVKRDGRKEAVKFDKITIRIEKLCDGLNSQFVKPVEIAKKVISGLFDGVTTTQLDDLAAETAASMATIHPDFVLLAARIAVSNLHKNTLTSFSSTMQRLYHNTNSRTGEKAPLISKQTYETIRRHAKTLDAAVDYRRDYNFDFFGFKTLERSYLIRTDGKVAERPQHLFMRVAVGIHGEDLEAALETYAYMSEKWFIHATPTLFNAGTPKPQLSSCFLLAMREDSIEGIYDTLKQCAKISKSAGGIGLSMHNIRSKGSYIKGTNGVSNGIIPLLRNFDMTARYVDQGGGKRKGSFAIYLEPWHPDISDFLQLKKNHGKEEMRARDLFYALWVPDLFMERVEGNDDWSLFSPDEVQLHTCFGDEFEKRYLRYEKEGLARKVVKAQDLWMEIMEAQIETGNPYLLFKDHANRKSNQKNLGTIMSSNLCSEIIQYTSRDEVAVCNLASISLPKFIKDGEMDFQKLFEVTKVVTVNLNKVIDINHYPVKEAKTSNMRHRPIGIGVQGLSDVFAILGFSFESEKARRLNKDIFETLYFAAMTASLELSKQHGPYETFRGSPVSKGVFQFDMWDVEPDSGRWDWKKLKNEVKKYGIRNSLLLAPMPTASTSQILGNTECFEPLTSNLYVRRVLSGEFIVINKYLMRDLLELGLWNEDMVNELKAHNGSVQNIPKVPQHIKDLYKTVWEISQRSIIDMAADRGAYICQSQSMNLFLEKVTFRKMTSMHFHAWNKGLKTGMYYLRTKPATDPIKFTLKKQLQDSPGTKQQLEPSQQEAVQPQQLEEASSVEDAFKQVRMSKGMGSASASASGSTPMDYSNGSEGPARSEAGEEQGYRESPDDSCEMCGS